MPEKCRGGRTMNSAAKPVATPTRRDVIATAGVAGVVAVADALTGRTRAEARKPPHVVIVGAGLSGLCAAYLLQQRNWTYTILEAERNHIGGRVRTMPIGNGLHWEAGAMRIPHNHHITLRYISQFPEIKTRTFVMNNDNAYLFARGYKVRAKDEDKIRQRFDLSRWERSQSSGALWNLAVHDLPNGLTGDQQKELRSGDWFTYAKLRKWDRLSLRQLIEEARV